MTQRNELSQEFVWMPIKQMFSLCISAQQGRLSGIGYNLRFISIFLLTDKCGRFDIDAGVIGVCISDLN